MRRLTVLVSVLAAVLLIPGVGSGAQKSGCSNDSSGWSEASVADAADRIWPALLDTSPWGGDSATFEAEVVGAYDANLDGQVCIKAMWGEDLNPNSHWYGVGVALIGSPTEQFLLHDNTKGAS